MTGSAKTMWFTGLSGSGKSTISEEVFALMKKNGMRVEYLDGDLMRSKIPSTGYTRSDRVMHLRYVGLMASLLERNGIYVVASFVSPYREARDFVRDLCPGYNEIYISTPLEICESRDVKGLYAKARRGEIKHFTGIDDPFEAPLNPELVIDTTKEEMKDSVKRVLRYAKKISPRDFEWFQEQ